MAAPEAPAVEPVVAEPVEEASPNPEPEEVTEGDAAPEAEGDEGRDYSAVEAELEAEVERRVAERAAKVEAEAEQRARNRAREADDGESARVALYETAESEARRSAANLRKLVDDGEAIDQATLTKHMDPIIAGVQALTAKANEADVKKFLEVALPDQTDQETAELESLLYDFRRNGKIGPLQTKALELALGRKDAEIADLKKELAERKSIKALAEKLANVHEQAGAGAGAETPKGTATSAALTVEEANNLPVEELKRRGYA